MIKKFEKLSFLFVFLLALGAFSFLIKEIHKTEEEIIKITNHGTIIHNSISYTYRSKTVPFQLPLWEELKKEIVLSEKSFIVVDLEKMKTFLYENGTLKDEIPILAKGNPFNWGGSPSGFYDVMAKYTIAYSNSTQVYMPFAIQYYGKYFFHGVPYYPGGKRIYSVFSGGCLRYVDQNAKKLFDFSEEEMPVLVIDKHRDNFQYSNDMKDNSFPDLSSESFIIADIGSGTVLAEKNSGKRMPIASITKLMTAIVVLENIGLNRNIMINEEMIETYGYTPGFEAEKKYQLMELLYPLLTRSSNQAAEALTGYMGRDETIELMNKKAESITMKQTFFTDPSGLDSGNISTARDLFYLARYIYNNFIPVFSISKGERVPLLQFLRFDLEELGNKNIFIYDPTFVGGKTGFTNASKQTALFVFKFPFEENERKIAMIFLKSKNVKTDTQKVYRWLLDGYFKNS